MPLHTSAKTNRRRLPRTDPTPGLRREREPGPNRYALAHRWRLASLRLASPIGIAGETPGLGRSGAPGSEIGRPTIALLRYPHIPFPTVRAANARVGRLAVNLNVHARLQSGPLLVKLIVSAIVLKVRLSLCRTSIQASFRCFRTRIVSRRWIGWREPSGSANAHACRNPMGESGTRRWKPIKASLCLRAGLPVMKTPQLVAKDTRAFANR
jgi:hypothetical protein